MALKRSGVRIPPGPLNMTTESVNHPDPIAERVKEIVEQSGDSFFFPYIPLITSVVKTPELASGRGITKARKLLSIEIPGKENASLRATLFTISDSIACGINGVSRVGFQPDKNELTYEDY